MSKRFLVSTLCLNRKEGLRACLTALFQGNPKEDFDVVLTDQASTDGTAELMDEFQGLGEEQQPWTKITVFHEKQNTGFQAPNLRAWRMAIAGGYKFLLLLNDDTLPPPSMLAMLAQPFRANPKLAIVGPSGTCCSLNEDFHGTGGSVLEYIEGSCMCINVELVKKVVGSDLWDKNLEFIYSEDSCLSLKVREAGYQIGKVPFTLEHSPNSTTMHGDPAVKEKCMTAQAKNHAYALKRWGHYLKHRRFNYPTVLRRQYAIGDVVLLTPIIEAVHKSNPLSNIHVETDFPWVFNNNPVVVSASRGFPNVTSDALVIDLNDSYEHTISTHIVHAYAAKVREQLFDLPEPELRTFLYPGIEDQRWAREAKQRMTGGNRMAVLHVGPSWPGKTWPAVRFAELATKLVLDGWHVVCVGAGAKPHEIADCIDLTGRTPGLRLAALLQEAQLFVGIDSFPMHAALSMGTPTVGLFGVSTARYILTDGAPRVGIDGDIGIPSTGSRHRVTGTTFIDGGQESIESISVGQVWNGIKKVLQG